MHNDWFQMIQSEILSSEKQHVSLSLIDYAWRSIKYNKKFRESYHFGFSECQICAQNIVSPLSFNSFDFKQKTDIMQIHLGSVRVCRFFYLVMRKAAYRYPKKILFLEGDRQDSKTTAMPYMARGIKNKEYIQKINLTMQGFLTNGTKFYAMINLPNHRKDSNNSLTSRFLTLVKHCSDVDGLPPILIIQTDSCAGENKSRVILKFHCWLIMTGKCQAINLSFPWVGHSHGSVDAVFGKFSSSMRKAKNVFTLDELKQVMFFVCIYSFCIK